MNDLTWKALSRKAIRITLQYWTAFVLMAGLLFAECLGTMQSFFGGAFFREITAFCQNVSTQWVVTLCFLAYFFFFLFFENLAMPVFRPHREQPIRKSVFPRLYNRTARAGTFLLAAFVLICFINYAGNYAAAAHLQHPLMLLMGIVFGKAFAIWASFHPASPEVSKHRIHNRVLVLVLMLIGLLSLAAIYQPERSALFGYHGVQRWCGPWDNPNSFGLLMGTGLVVAIGCAISSLLSVFNRTKSGRRKIGIKNLFFNFFYVVAILFLGRGLFHSLSRGAWLGVSVALVYLIFFTSAFRVCPSIIGRWFETNRKTILGLLLALAVIFFWPLRFSSSHSAQRIASVANPNDFSWRNRVAAWQGATRMIWDRPLAGFGWNEVESVYARSYYIKSINESASLDTNEYLLLGIFGGVPLLFCLVGYVVLAFRQRTDVLSDLDKIRIICRTGSVVLLVGFWFDGGLFNLPTGVVFWLLLELSRLELAVPETVSTSMTAQSPSFIMLRESSNRWLSKVTWMAVMAAIIVSAIYLITPQFSTNKYTLQIARIFLVHPREQKNFDLLAAQPIWRDQKLKALLNHEELATYNRKLVNWQIDDALFRDFVLSPVIESSSNTMNTHDDLNWRRLLWEDFYPRIHNESSPEAAATIIMSHLHERVTIIVSLSLPYSVPEILRRGTSDSRGFFICYVAALRSVGIPARLTFTGQVEFWTGSEWKPAPRQIATTRGNSGESL